MRKGWIVLLTAVLVAAFALPAMADIKASGFYRAKGWVSNFTPGSGAPTLRTGESGSGEVTNAFVEQRLRVKFDFGTENVKAVWFTETDFLWGDVSMTNGRNQGGALGGDTTNTEAKNVYLWFKVPDTSVDVTVGLQNQSDHYAGVLFGGADMAGVFINGKFEPVKYTLGIAKLYENAVAKTDDSTLYLASAQFNPTKAVNVGLNFYFLQDDSGKSGGTGKLDPLNTGNQPGTPPPGFPTGYKLKLYNPGVNATFKAGPATISGFAFYQFGKFENVNAGVADVDVNAYAADLRADVKIGSGNLFVEGLYLSGGDNPTREYKAPIGLGDYQGSSGSSAYSRTNTYIMLSSPDFATSTQCFVGCASSVTSDSLGNQGRGIWTVAAGYSQNFTEKVRGQFNVAYLSATKLLATGDAFRDKDFGTEVNARLDYSIAKGLEVGLVGAYVFMGDFLRTPTASFKDPWSSYARVNYAF